MKRRILNLSCLLLGINTFLIILFLVFICCAFNRNTYYKYYENDSFQIYYVKENNKFDYDVTLSKNQIKKVLDTTLNYMVNKVETPQSEVTFSNDISINFYTEKEMSHLNDCQVLFHNFFSFLIILLVLSVFIIIIIYLLRKEFSEKTIKYFFIGVSINIVFILVIAIYCMIDFLNAFILFHKLIFKNDNYKFIYTSYMIQMLPEKIFKNIAYNIFFYFLLIMGLICCLLIILYLYLKKKKRAYSL